jgi:predicted RNA-binding Zn ribbon-like protein
METTLDHTRLRIVGGNLALDLANTRTGPPDGPPDGDALPDYGQLVAWAQDRGAVTEAEGRRLRDRARRSPSDARAAHEHAMRVRDAIDATFRAIARGRTPNPASMDVLVRAWTNAVGHAELAPGATAYEWSWDRDASLDRPVWPIVHAAIDLATRGRLDRIKACGGCSFLFFDESKNRSRRWCSMDDCGSSEKMRRYVARRAAKRRSER